MVAYTPDTIEGIAEVIRNAAAEGTPLAVIGHGSRDAIGRPTNTADVLSTAALSGIELYEPEELVIAARAGTPLADIEAALAEKGQMLAFEPPDLSRLLGRDAPDPGTLGGMTASGLAGPRRIRAGGVRDHLLGFEAVNGRGEIFKSGGRVMKNVTGYDLSKLMCGSWGTLAVLCRLTFKVLPAPETEVTLAWRGLGEEEANALMTAAMKTPWEVSAAVHLPAGAEGRDLRALTVLRIEGFSRSVSARAEALAKDLGGHGTPERLEAEDSRRLWRQVRDVAPFLDVPAEWGIWRLSVPPAAGAAVLARIRERLDDAAAFLDWAGGLIWLAAPMGESPETARAVAEAVRAPLKRTGGHATLIRAPAAVRAMVDVFHPQPAPLANLRERIRRSFDPAGILEPGRMYPPPKG